MRVWAWLKSLRFLGEKAKLKEGTAARFGETATFGTRVKGIHCWDCGSRRLAGITFPGNGRPEDGSMTFRHLGDFGLAWQNAELVGKIPVPAESSARFPASCARLG